MLNYIANLIFMIPLCFMSGGWNLMQNLLIFVFFKFLMNAVSLLKKFKMPFWLWLFVL